MDLSDEILHHVICNVGRPKTPYRNVLHDENRIVVVALALVYESVDDLGGFHSSRRALIR